jgi:hypothetical protein
MQEAQPVTEIVGVASYDPAAPRVREVQAAVREAIAGRVEAPA